MTRVEALQFLSAGAPTAKVAITLRDGTPHVVPVWFTLDNEKLVFMTWHESAKARSLRRDSRIAICVDDDNPPFAFAAIQGRASISENAGERARFARLSRHAIWDPTAPRSSAPATTSTESSSSPSLWSASSREPRWPTDSAPNQATSAQARPHPGGRAPAVARQLATASSRNSLRARSHPTIGCAPACRTRRMTRRHAGSWPSSRPRPISGWRSRPAPARPRTYDASVTSRYLSPGRKRARERSLSTGGDLGCPGRGVERGRLRRDG